jgi:hypothetical protein
VPQLQEIVQVDITRETSRITQVGFGRALLAVSGFEDATSDKVREYGSLADVLMDFTADSTAYAGAAAYFGQQRRPASLLIGEYDSAAPVTSLNAIDAVNPDWYCLLVADEDGEVEGDSREDRLVDIAAWIETQERICILSAIGADTVNETDGDDLTSLTARLHAAGYTRTATLWTGGTTGDISGSDLVTNGDFADGGTGWVETFGSADFTGGQATITTATADDSSATLTQEIEFPAAGTYRVTFDLISVDVGINGLEVTVSGLSPSGRAVFDLDIESKVGFVTVAEAGEFEFNIYVSAVNLNGLDVVIDNVTCLLYNELAPAIDGPAAWAGRMLPTDPGTQTWAHKRLIGVESANLSTAQRTNLFAKKGNLLSTISGLSNTRYGTMASGEFIDIIRGLDWLTQRMREDIFRAFVNTGKIPYTGAGIAAIENIVRARLRIAQAVGLIAPDTANVPGFTLTVPTIGDTQIADRSERLLTGIEFNARLAGAVHIVEITGRVAP